MNFFKRISLFILAVTFMAVGLGVKEASAYCTAPLFEPVTPTLAEVFITNATPTKEGTLTAYVMVQDGYDKYMELVFTRKDGEEVSRVKIDNIINMKTKKQTVDGRDGKQYSVTMKWGTIKVSAGSLPLPLADFIAAKDSYTIRLETSNYVPSTTKSPLPAVIYDASCSQTTLTSADQPISLANTPFPGKVEVKQDGTIIITLEKQDNYADAKIFLVVVDGSNREVKRIAIDTKNPRVSASDLALPSGAYLIYMELTYGTDSIQSVPVHWTIPVQSSGPSPVGTVGSGYGAFPGGVEVTENGAIRITIQSGSYDSAAKFYLVISDSTGKEVKRIRVYPNNPRVSLSSKSLNQGVYTVEMEMINGSVKVRSNPVTWTIAPPQISIPSGDDFPGTIIVNPDGTYTVTVTLKTINKNYDFYVVVWDADGNEIKRIKFDPNKPFGNTLDGLKLLTGGYYIVIEVTDPKTGGKATSKPTFTTYNGTQGIIVLIDDQLQQYDQTPVNVDGRTMVPLRAIFEALGAKVEWDGATQTVTATKDDTTVVLTINSNEAWVNGKKVLLDVPAKLINENTMVPIRFVSEALGANVEWDNYSQSVIIRNKE